MNITSLDLESNWDFLKVIKDNGQDDNTKSYTGSSQSVIMLSISYQRLAFHFTSDPICCGGKGFSLAFKAVVGMFMDELKI